MTMIARPNWARHKLGWKGQAEWASPVLADMGHDGIRVMGINTPIAGFACPPLVPDETTILFRAGLLIEPEAGCTAVTVSINDWSGSAVIGGPIGVWTITQPIVGVIRSLSFEWAYIPGVSGADLADGTGKAVALNIYPSNGNCNVGAPILVADPGIEATTS